MNKCWECKHFEYDEIYVRETSEEIQIAICKKGNDCDESEQCNDFDDENE